MPTVKELKKELKEKEIPYPKDALKADLEDLLSGYESIEMKNGSVVVAKSVPQAEHFKSAAPNTDIFIDPNADPGTQA